MKPIYIKMQAFGSYQQECIFFEKADHGLFLITGDTGAGKTTIFDAIVFALYGKTSGGKRDGKMMRSQYAPADIRTKVEYKFRYQESEYTIIRSPEQANWKKVTDDEGKEHYEQLATPLKPKVELIMPDGSVYLGKLKEINTKIEEIIGLNADQFTQIAMLAQGDFIKLLHASSEERKEIFAKIFDTKLYEYIEIEAAKRAKAVLTELVRNRSDIEGELGRVKYIEGSSYAEEWDSEKYKKKFSETESDKLLELVSQICEEGRKKQEKIDKDIKAAEKETENLNVQISLAKTLNELFEDLNKCLKTKYALEEKSQEIESLRQKVEAGERALEAEKDYNDLRQKEEEHERCQKRIKELEQWISENKEKSALLKKRTEEAKKKSDSESPQIYAELEDIARSLDRYDELAGLLKNQEEVKKSIEQSELQAEKIKNKKEVSEDRLKELSDNTEELKKKTDNPIVLENEIKIIQSQKKDLEEIINNLSELQEINSKLEQKEKEYHKAEEKKSLAQEEYEHLYQKFISSQAAVIRMELKEEEPCPVCGSIHHKLETAAKIPEEAMPDDKVLKKEKSKLDRVAKEKEDAYKEWHNQLSDKKGILRILDAGCRKIFDSFDEKNIFLRKNLNTDFDMDFQINFDADSNIDSDKDFNIDFDKDFNTDCNKDFNIDSDKDFDTELREKISSDYEAVCEEINNKNTAWTKAVKNTTAIEKNEKDIEALRKQTEKLAEEFDKIKSEINELKLKEGTNSVKITELKKQLVYSDKAQALSEQKKKQLVLEKLKKTVQKSEDESITFEKEINEKSGKLSSEKENLKRFDMALRQAEDKYKTSLKNQKFESTEDFQAALLKKDIIKKFQNEIDNYEKKLAIVNDNAERLTKKTEGKQKADTAQYETRKDELKKLKNTLNKDSKIIFNLVSVNKEAYQRGCELYEKRKELQKTAAILTNLDNTVNGKLSGKHMNFQTYIQRRYFRQIIEKANRRLYVMSGNQFLLRCRDMKNLGAQGYVGLDLDIYSVVNDQTRDVKTLSGGESFMAALSMALGMADIIQSSRGSVHIDTMFIDEGFGSLSEETRNQAIHILNELSEGKRLVGIISHVSELKSQVETKLLVKKTDKGSRAVWEE